MNYFFDVLLEFKKYRYMKIGLIDIKSKWLIFESCFICLIIFFRSNFIY